MGLFYPQVFRKTLFIFKKLKCHYTFILAVSHINLSVFICWYFYHNSSQFSESITNPSILETYLLLKFCLLLNSCFSPCEIVSFFVVLSFKRLFLCMFWFCFLFQWVYGSAWPRTCDVLSSVSQVVLYTSTLVICLRHTIHWHLNNIKESRCFIQKFSHKCSSFICNTWK